LGINIVIQIGRIRYEAVTASRRSATGKDCKNRKKSSNWIFDKLDIINTPRQPAINRSRDVKIIRKALILAGIRFLILKN
jgi:hypothetical protein